MMKKFFILSAVLAAGLMLGACGNQETPRETLEGNAGENSKEKGSEALGEDGEDISEITMAFFTGVEPNSESLQAVEDAINEISENKINVHVNLLPLGMGSYDQQVNLMIAGNEDLDLMATFFAGSTAFSSMQAQNQCMPLNDYMEEYAPDVLSLFEKDELETCSQNGELLGVPMYKDNVSNIYFTMRTDILEQLGLLEKAQNISSMADIEEILLAVKENTDLTPIASSQAAGPLHFTNVLFENEFFAASVFTKMANDYIGTMDSQPEAVVCLYETPEYKASVKLVKDWYDKGLVYKDSATSTDSNYTQIASGKFFSTFFTAQNATKISTIASCEYDMTTVMIYSLPLETTSYNTNTWVVPVTSKEPEAAVKFLNLMYTDKEVVDLLNYGIEGSDYVVKDDGTYGYPKGYDSTNAGYHIDMTWLFGNQYLAGVWEGDDPESREISKEINAEASKSATFGFSADVSEFGTQIAAITSAVNEYAGTLQNGLAQDVDATLEEFLQKLNAAGIDQVADGVQAQLDAWISQE